jgi:acetyl-CoA acetyltransferase
MDYKTILIEPDEHNATLYLNRPESENVAKAYNLKPRARVLFNANWGVDPEEMLDGVIPGTRLP